MSESWSEQDRKDLRRAQLDLEECRQKIKDLRAVKNKALEALKKALCALEFPYEVPWTPEQQRNELRALIAELEEVK